MSWACGSAWLSDSNELQSQPNSDARRAAIFVLSDVRSGSTLLDQCLGAHPRIVSLGEVHWLAAYLAQDRAIYDPVHPLVCSCGASVDECDFWVQVARELGRPLETLQLRPRFAEAEKLRRDAVSRLRRFPRRLAKAFPAAYRLGAMQWMLGDGSLARDCVDLYDAACRASGRPYCVDSSKSPYRFRAVSNLDSSRTLAVILVRDYRAVVHSKMKRGEALESAAVGWRKRMQHIEVLTRDVPTNRKHFVKFETLCEEPRATLAMLCDFLGLEFTDAMLKRPKHGVHHLGGSPSKFDESKESIVIDRSHETVFSGASLARLEELAGTEARKWGY